MQFYGFFRVYRLPLPFYHFTVLLFTVVVLRFTVVLRFAVGLQIIRGLRIAVGFRFLAI